MKNLKFNFIAKLFINKPKKALVSMVPNKFPLLSIEWNAFLYCVSRSACVGERADPISSWTREICVFVFFPSPRNCCFSSPLCASASDTSTFWWHILCWANEERQKYSRWGNVCPTFSIHSCAISFPPYWSVKIVSHVFQLCNSWCGNVRQFLIN